MKNICEDEFLMLLLVMQADFDKGEQLVQFALIDGFDQIFHCPVDVRTIGGDFLNAWARDKPALRPIIPRTGSDVIGIEQKRETLVQRPIASRMGQQQE